MAQDSHLIGLGALAARPLGGQAGVEALPQHLSGALLPKGPCQASGVAVDEEMLDVVKFQNAFSAAAKVINVVDEMLDTVVRGNDGSAIGGMLDRLQAGHNQLLDTRTDLGSKLGRLDFAESVLERVDLEMRAQLGASEDVDLVSVLSQFRLEETALQASLQMAARLVQPSLLDCLK